MNLRLLGRSFAIATVFSILLLVTGLAMSFWLGNLLTSRARPEPVVRPA